MVESKLEKAKEIGSAAAIKGSNRTGDKSTQSLQANFFLVYIYIWVRVARSWPPPPPWYGPPPYPAVLAATVVVLVLVLRSTIPT